VAQTFVLGLAFGFARHVSGSLLGSIVLHVGVNGAGVAGLALAPSVAIPGYNAPGAHTPLVLLVSSLASVALGGWWLARETSRPPEPDGARPDEDRDEGA
jgi:hypothetical protein